MQARLKQSSRLLLLRVSLACKSRACPLLCAEEGVPVRRIQGPTSAFFLVLVVAIACPCKHKILCLQGHAMATTSMPCRQGTRAAVAILKASEAFVFVRQRGTSVNHFCKNFVFLQKTIKTKIN